MGQSQSLSTQVEIQASPDAVRSIFMDFPRYKQWTNWSITPIDSSKTSADLKPNDRLKVDIGGGMAFQPLVMENSPDTFQWLGALPVLFSGKHEFHFSPSNKHPGGTTVVQLENFTGLLAFLMGPGWSMRQSTLDKWDAFFADLKKEVEES
ncbi:hypothetical protein LTR10_023811 [Elasticomyces elasticus]|uniref:SRPBCC domain-containing protein n=1 Tax=Exophiala sideris TaxID=1016849 RepID=A0ABR0J5V9_9EURO|nr:hypothetical protein LTR10_023811 [Elasticomyces elasticus]KAK5028685.1 hypothetical protein LTS07_006064 [Exophiala sideris]KAK5035553.1 hypothetical protein LTR13_005682 [Exophiala sideris]KAK5057189.1 hypothetical protein LTR69_007228 [Exophiala sideris]KAK5181838.1 hypothetical protein LTR44_006038 [Eurotiomycetes sp. CCFEE 6388]